jgi:hypothetical protein
MEEDGSRGQPGDDEMDVGIDAEAGRLATRPAVQARGGRCLLSLVAFGAAMAGVVFFCTQAWVAMGPWSNWRVNGPLTVLQLPWMTLAGDLGLALLCGTAACGAFLLGSALTGLIAERKHPLMP